MELISQQILSEITIFSKYAKYIPSLKRRETWDEIVDRYEEMMKTKYPVFIEEISQNCKFIRSKKILPSMRALQFAGMPIYKNNSRIYNCAYLPIDDYRAFSETMFLLLSGAGVGYSVQLHHVEKLPLIIKPQKTRKYLIGDSIEGWGDAVKALMKAFMCGKSLPLFDYSDIRPKGATLVTAGGKAPGAEPLKECLFQIQKVLERKEDNSKLTSLECHDILCFCANAVLAGGIRRAAMIALFSINDEDMLYCKAGRWWELNEQRGRANNSVVLERSGKEGVDKKIFENLWTKIEQFQSGEPGILWTNNKEIGVNPCCEISLNAFQFCNLSEVNVSNIETQEELNERVRMAAFFGTLQAGFTDFHYLREIWKKNTEGEALVGVGMTGIASGRVQLLDLNEAAEEAKKENSRVAQILNLNEAARVTTIKPSGTTSCVLGVSSGIHAWHSDYYLRRQRVAKNEPLYHYFKENHPQLLEIDQLNLKQAIICLPQKAPSNSIVRERETALDMMERVKLFNEKWVRGGHRSGDNYNNVSATITVKKEEWLEVGEWMWENKDYYNGLSVLPYDGGSYIQPPFEAISKEEFEELYSTLSEVSLSNIVEVDDITNQTGELACSANGCEIENF